MSLKRRSEADSDAAEKRRAARVTPTSKAFTARIALRDTNGIEYALPLAGDAHAAALASHVRSGEVYFIRRARRSARAAGQREAQHLRRGGTVRLLDLEQRTEFTATVADVQVSDRARSTSGYVVLTSKSAARQVTDPREFGREN
jgi:hypothetical protein